MRVESIKLTWFRGAADPVPLELNCKSMVVYGDNGSGKSSSVDGLEYVLNSGSIEHLRNEYSGFRQEKAIPNTHKPQGSKTSLEFRFKDESELRIDFNANGSSKSSGGQNVGMAGWEYRQTVLRQDEVSRFIHDTKGGKYSALLPLFGLQNLEFAAENLRKLARTIESECKLNQKDIQLKQAVTLRNATFGTQSYNEIIEIIHNLFAEYCKENSTTIDSMALCNEWKKL